MAYDLVNLTYRYPVNKQQSKKTNKTKTPKNYLDMVENQ